MKYVLSFVHFKTVKNKFSVCLQPILPERVTWPVSAVTHAFEELEQVRVGVEMSCNLLGELVVIHPLTQLQREASVIRNIFITKVYFHLNRVYLE